MYRLFFFFFFYERLNDIATDWQTSLLRETRVWLCVPRPAQVVDKTAFLVRRLKSAPRRRPRSCASQSKRTGWRQMSPETQVSPWSFEIDLEVLRFGLGADLFLGCRHQLRQSWRCENSQLFFFFFRRERKPSAAWDGCSPASGEREDTCCVRYLCCCPHGAGKVCLDAHTKLCY